MLPALSNIAAATKLPDLIIRYIETLGWTGWVYLNCLLFFVIMKIWLDMEMIISTPNS
jgi:hypothetical protein